MAEIKIFGYTNKISVKQGEEIDFHVYADGTDVADAKLVRLIHGDEHPDGPGFVEEVIDNDINGKWKVEKQGGPKTAPLKPRWPSLQSLETCWRKYRCGKWVCCYFF